MFDLVIQVAIFIVSALALWWGTGLVVASISSIARSLNISAFTLSFFVLGILTSLPETTIGLTSLYRGEAAFTVGNLIGGTLVVFLLVIPLLGLFGGTVNLPKVMHRKQLILSLITILAPALLIADRSLHLWEGVLLVLLYGLLFVVLSSKESLYEKIVNRLRNLTHKSEHRTLKVIAGIIIILVASQFMVNTAEYFAIAFNWSPFVVGLIIVALGTNIPELSLVLRASLSGKSEVALADYIGSAATNTLLIGLFTIFNGKSIVLPNHALVRIVILAASLLLFYIFIRSQKKLTKVEALVLLLIYVIFVVIEVGQA
ncbi:hypothetical protein DCC61_01510 [Candidatus Microgenomates bacterium]|nr:sodium:calcium antiporter [Candidatus Microgenomates bacterium CPR3]RIK51737.1 MAG: hypothetical protein DCC61_01510 [Candidatus Microgenomates bacterium]